MSVTRIALADDHDVVRAGLSLLFDARDDFQVVATAGDIDAALRVVLAHRPDVLVLDLHMPGTMSALEAIPLVRERSPATATVVLTMEEDPVFARQALRAGALGYVLKTAVEDELVDAVGGAARGEQHINPSLGARLVMLSDEAPGPPGDLSVRELEVLQLLVLGYTNNDIGDRLFLSVRTVETHRAHVQQKTLCRTRAQLVRYAQDHGLLDTA